MAGVCLCVGAGVHACVCVHVCAYMRVGAHARMPVCVFV